MKPLIFFLCLFFSLTVKSQSYDSETLYNKVVLLYDHRDGKPFSGTGFILIKENSYFLVTAKHVTDSISVKSCRILFRSLESTAQELTIKEFASETSQFRFDHKSDYAILELEHPTIGHKDILQRSAIEFSAIIDSRESIPRFIDILVLGYTLNAINWEDFSPISLKSYIASSLLNVKINNVTNEFLVYVIGAPSLEGFSGGPIFGEVIDHKNNKLIKTILIGIVTGNIDNRLGFITPSFYLLDLINSSLE